MSTKVKRGTVTYDSEYGHVCTCTERLVPVYIDGMATNYMNPTYSNSVRCDRSTATESGSFLYYCDRCGASAWSGL